MNKSNKRSKSQFRVRSRQILISYILIILIFIPGCRADWEIELTHSNKVVGIINVENVSFYLEKIDEETTAVPLGQLFFDHGFSLIEEITLSFDETTSVTFVWDEIAKDSTLSTKGELSIDDKIYKPEAIDVISSSILSEKTYSVLDIAPTIAFSMELPDLPERQGQVRVTHAGKWDRAVMILLDGLQYEKLISLINEGELPFMEKLTTIHQGVTVYPPISTSASGAILTGTQPKVNGVFGYGYRSTEITTLFDLAVGEGKNVIAVEGASLPFNLRNAEVIISGDRDGNGFVDDNTFSKSIKVILSNLPDLLYIHFHDIDDMGHSFGPNSPEYEAAITRVDQYLAQIYNSLPENTFITIFADHGMHKTEDGGNHGALIASDIIIPIIFFEK